MDPNATFVAVHLSDEMECEGGCERAAGFRLVADPNGALVCQTCANELGTVHEWEKK